MRITPSILFAMPAVVTTAGAAPLADQRRRVQQYAAPDGGLRVVVAPASKQAERSEFERKAEFQSGDGELLAPLTIPRKIVNTVSGL
jgi:hypothetical protein